VEYLTPEAIEQAWALFRRFDDKEFSFTDCTSIALMRSLALREALAFDGHFTQAGFVELRL
jgi:predicted nucleic acid-binding protein